MDTTRLDTTRMDTTRMDTTRLDTTRLDTTRLDTTRLDTTRGKAMRILHIIATLDPASGGPSESVRTLMGFGVIGYTGEVATLDDPNAPFLKGLPFPVHALGPVSMTYSFSPKLHGWLRANYKRFDGVVVNGLWNYCGLVAWMVLAGKKPYMVFSHGMLDPYFKRSFRLKHLKKWVYWLLAEYWVLRRAHRVLFTTKEESELARKSFWLHRWNGYVVPYGCSRPNADAASMLAAFGERMPEMDGKRFMLYLGRIHRKKGCEMLIASFCKYAALDPGLHLVMAGPDQQGWSGELQQMAVEQGVGERVHWPGMVKGDAKWGAFYACEVFILPSHQENFGIAVAEALACGKAVLLADKVNIAPQISQDGCGLMELDDQDGTDNLVRKWIEMPAEKRRAMERQALVTFRERYDMQANAATIMRLFEG
jgi:glycosyltransferase involved in cell wall biosynthesis